MTDGDVKQFGIVILKLAEGLGGDMPASRIDFYFQALSSYSIDEIEQAAAVLARESRFFPKPVDFIATIEASTDRRPQHSTRPVSTEGPCYYCGDSGFQTIYHAKPYERTTKDGERYTAPAGGTSARPCACIHAPASMRSDFPLREPNWKREPAGRWWTRVDG